MKLLPWTIEIKHYVFNEMDILQIILSCGIFIVRRQRESILINELSEFEKIVQNIHLNWIIGTSIVFVDLLFQQFELKCLISAK